MSDSNTDAKTSTSGKRQADVLLHIKQKGSATIGELAQRFEVSEMTVRRILHRLSDLSQVIRTPGGAMAAPGGSMERTFLERSHKMSAAKNALGRVAASLVQDGETIVLDSGTTTQCIARHLAGRTNLVVITSSLAALEELSASTGIQVQLTGGIYRRVSHDLYGSAVSESLESIYADRVFFGAAALSFHKGAMNFDHEMPRMMLQAGKQKTLVIDSSKIGIEAVYRFCPIEQCDVIITDRGVKGADLQRLRKLTKVLIAD
jgi:DeoR/GlpR family transcriptional regulator of sugar metabolism